MRRGASIVVASAVGAVGRMGHPARRRPPGSRPRNPSNGQAVNPRAVVDRYCVTCHNQRTKTVGPRTRQVDITSPGGQRRGLGRRGAEAAHALDAAARHAAARRGDLRTRSRRSSRPSSIARRPRSRIPAGRSFDASIAASTPTRFATCCARRRRLVAAAAGRLCVRLRQHLRPAGDLAGAARALSRRRRSRQRAGGRRRRSHRGSDTYRIRQDRSQDQHIEGLPLGTSAVSSSTTRFRSTRDTASRWRSIATTSRRFVVSSTRIKSRSRLTANVSSSDHGRRQRARRGASRAEHHRPQ